MAAKSERLAKLEIKILSPHGLHMRPAALISGKLKDCPCEVSAKLGEKSTNAKSVAGLLILEAPPGAVLQLKFKGKGAKLCRDQVASLESEDLEVG